MNKQHRYSKTFLKKRTLNPAVGRSTEALHCITSSCVRDVFTCNTSDNQSLRLWYFLFFRESTVKRRLTRSPLHRYTYKQQHTHWCVCAGMHGSALLIRQSDVLTYNCRTVMMHKGSESIQNVLKHD